MSEVPLYILPSTYAVVGLAMVFEAQLWSVGFGAGCRVNPRRISPHQDVDQSTMLTDLDQPTLSHIMYLLISFRKSNLLQIVTVFFTITN